MSLSNDAVLNTLKNQFVCGFRNITGEPYAGKSGKHGTDSPAVVTTNGAGPHNVQMFIMSSDGTVLHCLPGFWAPQDLLHEINFALTLNRVWLNPNVSPEVKDKKFRQMHLADLRSHPKEMIERSHLQNFDAKHEKADGDSDFKIKQTYLKRNFKMAKNDGLKTTDQVVHERMAKRPFVKYEDFDVAEYTDYGKIRYDKKEETRLADASGGQGTKMKRKKK